MWERTHSERWNGRAHNAKTKIVRWFLHQNDLTRRHGLKSGVERPELSDPEKNAIRFLVALSGFLILVGIAGSRAGPYGGLLAAALLFFFPLFAGVAAPRILRNDNAGIHPRSESVVAHRTPARTFKRGYGVCAPRVVCSGVHNLPSVL